MRQPCYKCRYEHKPIDTEPCEHCSDEYMNSGDHPAFEYSKKQTHYDEIHAMSVEELASWLCDIAGWLPEYEGRMHPILEWLKQEVDDGEH